MGTMKKIAGLAAAGAALLALSVPAHAVLVSYTFEATNDCGSQHPAFPACTIDGSPRIAKFDQTDTGGSFTFNGTDFPTIDGSEFWFSNTDGSIPLSWTYTPGAGDPLIRFWVIKQGNDAVVVHWDNICGATGLLEQMTVACADPMTGGTWNALNGWSHISFYDTGGTNVPEPGTLALLGLGLMGMGFARRRKS